jgi:hypothetical protein
MLFRYITINCIFHQTVIKEDMRRVGHVALMGEKRNVYRSLVRKPEAKRLLGRCRHR